MRRRYSESFGILEGTVTLQIRAGTCETHGPLELESVQGAFSKARTPLTFCLAKVDQYFAHFQLEHQEDRHPTCQKLERYYPTY